MQNAKIKNLTTEFDKFKPELSDFSSMPRRSSMLEGADVIFEKTLNSQKSGKKLVDTS